ncbi:BirA family transcriptional regulator, biotin operon repressor / biotin-[acetyl-CoA-carboxylase] ligase [Anaerocolumna jejuensis DSM 15929]|uniref:biotin--[biotin carboxyl-carrier protein] ligase n=1 Tax=Anaerocolumna jejuensis DSM 15929 TaxID=1121322 RepID=A0A1M6YYG8_9FIRM|nr:biotin--[acetyl-CoA-carboxylase] ligase [Anaerocolumna jejuensis]SHL23344.1 BirA family transcriptional regulator, biotin operon repressor / biotin-[acetyl-CoA-carboxylase] ligase [Anaerocolumna jejuensis DSM 15929]
MEENSDKIDKGALEEALKTKYMGRKIFLYEQLDSTNAQAKRILKGETEEGTAKGYNIDLQMVPQDSLHGVLVLTEEQTAGRGRLGRDWSSPKRGGIWMSFLLKPSLPVNSCPMLTLVAAVAVNAAIRKVTGLESFIKWPNDIVINGKKVCGILTEAMGLSNEELNIVIGIGINANRKEFPEELRQSATSLSLEKGCNINRNLLIAETCSSLERYYEEFEGQGDLSLLKEEYEKYLINKGKQVRVLATEGEYLGRAIGINEQGALMVEGVEKEIHTIVSGEVSVRGVLGYV